MKKLFLLFLCVCLAFSLTFERPWNQDYWAKSNQYVITLLGVEVWNTAEMHDSVFYLDLLEMNEFEEDELDKAILNYNNAKQAKLQCDIIGEQSNNPIMVLNPLVLIIDLSYKEITEATISTCLSYGIYWRGTINHALNALENKYNQMEEKCGYAIKTYKEMEFSGMCDYSPEECSEIKAVAKNCNSEYYYGNYSKIYEVIDLVDDSEEEIYLEKPLISDYFKIMEILFSEEVKNIAGIAEEGENNLNLAKQDYLLMKNEVSLLKNKANTKYEELEKHNLEKIGSGSVITGHLGGEISSVPFEFLLEGENIEYANLLFDSSIIYYNEESKNYLKNSLENFEFAKKIYEDTYDEMEFLELEVIEIVGLKKLEAEEKINIFDETVEPEIIDSKIEMFLSQARTNYGMGEKSSLYGDKYFYYREAVKYINLAEISLGENEGDAEILFYSELSSLRLLIENAEKDELNMEYEKQMEDYLEKHPSPELLVVLEEIEKGIISKAELRYSYLEEERGKIRELVGISEDDFGQFINVLEDKEKYIFDGNGINYEKGIGKLKDLEDIYDEIRGTIMFEIKNVLPSKMKIKQSVAVGNCIVGDKCEVRIGIELNNPYEIYLENPKVTVELPFEMTVYKSEIAEGSEHINDVVVEENELNLYFFEIREKQTYYLLILKNTTVIEIEELKIESNGNPDGTAHVEYEYDADCKYGIGSFRIPELKGEVKKVEVDGVLAGTDGNLVKKELDEKNHEINVRMFVNDAFSLEKTNIVVAEIGLKRKIIYNLEIKAKINLDSVALILEEGYNDKVKELSVISYSGHQVTNKKTSSSGMYSFEVHDINEGETAVVRVEYIIDDSAGYIEDELKKMEEQNLSAENLVIIGEIEDLVSINDTTSALDKLKDLEKDIENDMNSKYKLEMKFESVKNILEEELGEIKQLLEENPGVEDEFITKLDFRKIELEKSLNDYSEINEYNLGKLEEIDEKWMEKEIKNFIKRIYSEYNGLKKELIEYGFSEGKQDEMNEFEEELMGLEVTYNLETVPDILNSLNELKEFLEEKKSSLGIVLENRKKIFFELKDKLNSVLELYSVQYEDAEGSNFESLFEYAPKNIESEIEGVEKKLQEYSLEEMEEEIVILENMEQNIDELMEYLEKESSRRISEIEILYSGEDFGEEKEKIDQAVDKLREFNSNKEYVKVLKGSELILKGEYTLEEEIDGMLLLSLTVLFILIMIIYLMKDQIIENLPPEITKFFIKKENEIKKLKRGDEE